MKKLEVKLLYKKILFATDGSEISKRAAEKIVELYKNWKCQVVVLHSLVHHVIHDLMLISSNKYSSYYTLEYVNEEKDVYRVLRETKEFFEAARIPVEARLVREYEPNEYIIKCVEDEDFDLVVLGVKGVHSMLKEDNIGSIPQKVMKHICCDILIIK